MRRAVTLLIAAVIAAGCTSATDDGVAPSVDALVASSQPGAVSGQSHAVRLLFAGDVMLGRRVAAVVAAEPSSVFEGIRFVVSQADVALANLESPFGAVADGTDDANLTAPAAAASLLASAGFDVMATANNHAGDAGPSSVEQTIGALDDAGLRSVGSGRDLAAAQAPVIVEGNGVRVAFLAFDLTKGGPAAGATSHGIACWDRDGAAAAIAHAARDADVVAVGLHGGVEYAPRPDPALVEIVETVAGWGADVVWAQGSHVPYGADVVDPDGDGRPALVAYGLGNLVFDQRVAGSQDGTILEVLADGDGPTAYRIGDVTHADLRARFTGWRLPEGDAVLLDGEWWGLTTSPVVEPTVEAELGDLAAVGDVSASGRGDVDGDGRDDLVVAFRRPYRPTPVTERFAGRVWTDAAGRSAHLGVFDAATGAEKWVAGALAWPISALAICDTGVAVAYEELDSAGAVASGAMTWRDFGFGAAPDLPGPGVPGCADADGDGRTDAVIVRS